MPSDATLPAGMIASCAARYVGVSTKTWRELRDRGVAPAGASPTGSPRHRIWSPRELEAWVAAGCPPQVEWVPEWTAIRRGLFGPSRPQGPALSLVERVA